MPVPATPRRRPGRWLVFAALVALVAAACGGGGGGSAGGDRPSSQESEGLDAGGGNLPPDAFEMADGSSVTLADLLDGRPLVVNYFASWCPPCRAELPDFAAVHADVGDRVDFVGLALQDPPDAAAELLDVTGVTYPWGLDPAGTMFAALGGFAMPTTFYVSADGEIVGRDNGAIDEGTLRGRLDDLFGVTP